MYRAGAQPPWRTTAVRRRATIQFALLLCAITVRTASPANCPSMPPPKCLADCTKTLEHLKGAARGHCLATKTYTTSARIPYNLDILECDPAKAPASTPLLTSVPTGLLPENHCMPSGVQNMTQIYIDSNAITAIGDDGFYGLLTLLTLSLRKNGIASISAHAFRGLPKLQVLNLRGNNLNAVPPAAFAGLGTLQQLDLSENPLAGLVPNQFVGLGDLRRLAIQSSPLASLPAGIFAGLGNLTALELDNSMLATVPAAVFAPLARLETLYMHGNRLRALPDDAFAGLASLQRLFLNENMLASLPAKLFEPLVELRRVNVEANVLATLGGAQFRTNTKLEIMELGRNPAMRSIGFGSFNGLRNVRHVRLHSTGLDALPPRLFRDLGVCQTIMLHNNSRLGTVGMPLGVFDGLGSLRELRLDTNPSWEFFCPLPNKCAIVINGTLATAHFDRPCICEMRMCTACAIARPTWALTVATIVALTASLSSSLSSTSA